MARKTSKAASHAKALATAPAIPPRRKCGAMQVHMWLLEQYPEFRVRQAELERATVQRLRLGARAFARTEPYRIPVVVHVVYNAGADNIDDAQVKSQIDALNRDYRAANADRNNVPTVWSGLVTDANIEFYLVSKDPSGTAHSGITRTKTTVQQFQDDDAVKSSAKGGADPWPTSKYLNLWVCALGNGLLGYAQFPGGPAATDGVVILNSAFGTQGTAGAPFNLGRTAAHEVGHYLNLRHIWGDTEDCSGSDFVADTPPAQHPNYGKPTFPHISCNNGPSGDIPGRSELTTDPSELAPWAGKGEPVNDVPRGQPGFKERVNFGRPIGNYVDEAGKKCPTNNGIIHYSKTGIHIVPARP